MPISKDERDRILQLLEAGQITAQQAAGLFDALSTEYERVAEPKRERILRLRATSSQATARKISLVATIPVALLEVCLRLGTNFFPQIDSHTVKDLLHVVEHGAVGRLLDVQDMEKGDRLEIFVEGSNPTSKL